MNNAARKTHCPKPAATPPPATPCSPRVKLVTVELVACVEEARQVYGPIDAASIARDLVGAKDREHLLVLHLDSAHQVRSCETASVGTINKALVHPREVFKAAILANATSIIVAHNHPSGDLTPSKEDRNTYDKISKAGELLGIPLLDFLIVSTEDSWAASEHWIC